MDEIIAPKAKATNKNRKFGRSGKSPSMCRYRAEMRWHLNKIRKLFKHIKRTKFHDAQAVVAYNKLTGNNLQLLCKGY